LFTGNFKDAEVLLSSIGGFNKNDLNLFEESVFGTMLQQMATSGKGFIYASMMIYFVEHLNGPIT